MCIQVYPDLHKVIMSSTNCSLVLLHSCN